VPFAVILGEDEQKEGKVKIKEMGLPEGHPDKDGILVDISNLPAEVKARLAKQAQESSGVAVTAEDGVSAIEGGTAQLKV
jgi:histidyl-tRNA synthetase